MTIDFSPANLTLIREAIKDNQLVKENNNFNKAIASNNKSNNVDTNAAGTSVAKEFETLFVDMMLKSMRSTAQPEDNTNAMEIYQGMLDGEYAKAMTDTNNFGVKDMVLNWMKETGGGGEALKSGWDIKQRQELYKMQANLPMPE